MARKGKKLRTLSDLYRSSDSSRFRENDQKHLFCIGIAILTYFLALAGAARSFDLPYFFYVNLLSAFYWVCLYISIYIYRIFPSFTINPSTHTRFFLQIHFIIATFSMFILSYQVLFGKVEKGNLLNPLQVFAQLSSFLFSFYFPLKSVKVRHLLLLCFFLSLLSSLHLKGIDEGVLSFVLLFHILFLFLIPLDYVYFSTFFCYFLHKELAEWGFYLAFQQAGYCVLSFFLEKGQSSAIPPKRIFSFLFLLFFQSLYGFVHFGQFSFSDPLKLAALLSGACIIFLSLKRRKGRAFIIPFFIYFFLSLVVGIISLPSETPTIWGIPHKILIFIGIHLWFFLVVVLFKNSLPQKKQQALVPLFFSGLFLFLTYCPELFWLQKWVEGINLFLLSLGLFIINSMKKRPLRRGKRSGYAGSRQPDYFTRRNSRDRNWFNKKGRELHRSETFFPPSRRGGRLCRRTTLPRLYSIMNGQRID